jgi:hypothetical protein
VLTRWGTRIQAASYYACHWEAVCEIVQGWQGDCVLVQAARASIAFETIYLSLVQLERYKQIPAIISKLEDDKTTIMQCYQEVLKFLGELDEDDAVRTYLVIFRQNEFFGGRCAYRGQFKPDTRSVRQISTQFPPF